MALGGALPQTSRGLPVYLLTRKAAQSDNPLSQAELIGWQFLIVGGQPGLAMLAGDTEPAQHFAGVTHGVLPQRIVDAASLAEPQINAAPETYEPRLLESPELHLFCLWFKGVSSDRFVSLMDGQPPGSAPLVIESDILPRIQAALAAKTGRPPSGGATTN